MCYRWIARDNCEETLGALFGTLAYDKRQLPKRGGAAVSSTVPSAAISATRPSFCQSANGWRS